MKNERYCFLNMDEMNPILLHICDFGIEWRQNEKYDFRNDRRKNYEGYLFQYTMEGCGRFETIDSQIELNKGKAFLVSFPSKSRYFLHNNDTWHYFYIHFTGIAARYFYDYIHEKRGDVFTLADESSCIELFMKEFKAVKDRRQYIQYESGEFLYRFLTALCRDIEKLQFISNRIWVEAAKEWIENNYTSDKNISDMCDSMGLSMAHVSRQFHTYVGFSPIQYLNKLRIEQSMFLLVNTDLSMNKIAGQSGFANGNYYSKAFRKLVGMTPTQYRNSFR
jgi:Transcriptional regulator containing an amidase domain and an AraC-type DNA-binding HTH domain